MQGPLTRYASERFLYRLSISPYRDQFVLKGGNLFIIWMKGLSARPTIDTDLLRHGDASEDKLREIFVEIANASEQSVDGIIFDTSSIKIETIRKATEYGGTRITLLSYLGRSEIRLQFDIGVGDQVTPEPQIEEFPSLLDRGRPRIKVYPMASVIAEKAQIMISLGLVNSRMKDFFDLWFLSQQFEHDFNMLVKAITNTFKERNEEIPSFKAHRIIEDLAQDKKKQREWKAFLRKMRLTDTPQQFDDIMAQLKDFLLPPLTQQQQQQQFSKWIPRKGWVEA